jgi:hypothetical protein
LQIELRATPRRPVSSSNTSRTCVKDTSRKTLTLTREGLPGRSSKSDEFDSPPPSFHPAPVPGVLAALLLAAAPWLQANDILSSQPIMLAAADNRF